MSFNISFGDLADAAAFWGAITGTCALLFQASTHLKNRARLKLSPKMTIGASFGRGYTDSAELIDFEVNVVNIGQRVAIVDKVSISVKYSWWKSRLLKHNSANIIVFPEKSDEEHKILTEGQKYSFKLRRWDEDLQSLSECMNDHEYVMVRLTTGQVIKSKFKTIKFSEYITLRQQYTNAT